MSLAKSPQHTKQPYQYLLQRSHAAMNNMSTIMSVSAVIWAEILPVCWLWRLHAAPWRASMLDICYSICSWAQIPLTQSSAVRSIIFSLVVTNRIGHTRGQIPISSLAALLQLISLLMPCSGGRSFDDGKKALHSHCKICEIRAWISQGLFWWAKACKSHASAIYPSALFCRFQSKGLPTSFVAIPFIHLSKHHALANFYTICMNTFFQYPLACHQYLTCVCPPTRGGHG